MQVSDRTIVVLGTGGTIAGRAASAADNIGYRAAEVAVAELVQGLPATGGLALHTEQVAQIDSKDMDFAVWAVLAVGGLLGAVASLVTRTLFPNSALAAVSLVTLLVLWPKGNAMTDPKGNPGDVGEYEEPR